MKKIITLIFLLSISGLLTAQSIIDKVRVTQGPMNKGSMKFFFVYADIFGHDESQLYVKGIPTARLMTGTTGTKNVRLYSVGKDLNPSEGVVQETDLQGKDSWDEFNVVVGGNPYVFYSFKNQKLKKSILFAKRINKKSLEQEGDLKVVAEIDYSKSDKYKSSTFAYALSPDSSKLLISFGLLNKDQMLIGFGFNVLNDEMKIEWGKKNELPTSVNKVYTLEKYCVSNEGDVYLLSKIYDTKKDFKNSSKYQSKFLSGADLVEVPNYDYTVFSYRNKGEDNNENPLEIKGKFLRSLTLNCAPDGKLVCAGLYGDKESLSATGCCTFIISGAEKPNVNMADFSMDLIIKGMSKADESDARKAIKNHDEFEDCMYKLPELIFRADGGFWMAAEQTRQKITQSKNGTLYTFESNSTYVASFSADGSVLWTNKLFKEQKTTDMHFVYSSLKLMAIDDNLFILHNELPWATMGGAALKKSRALLTEYDAAGKETTRELFDHEKSEVTICPIYSELLDQNNLVAIGIHNAKYRFVKVSFNR